MKIILAITVAIATNYAWVNMPVLAQTRSISSAKYSIAQENNSDITGKIKYIVFIKGSCKKLIFAGSDLTSACPSVLMHTSYKIGRGSFAAQLSSGVVSFSGTRDVQPSVSRYTLYLDKILVVSQESGTTKTESVFNDTVGSCDIFGNFMNEISTIKCKSREKDGTVIELEFITDGTSPEITRFP